MEPRGQPCPLLSWLCLLWVQVSYVRLSVAYLLMAHLVSPPGLCTAAPPAWIVLPPFPSTHTYVSFSCRLLIQPPTLGASLGPPGLPQSLCIVNICPLNPSPPCPGLQPPLGSGSARRDCAASPNVLGSEPSFSILWKFL